MFKSSTFGSRRSIHSKSEECSDPSLIDELTLGSFEVKSRALSKLKTRATNDPRWYEKLAEKYELIELLSKICSDDDWELRYQCIKFLCDTTADFGRDCQWCLASVGGALVHNLCDSKITVRKAATQALVEWCKLTSDVTIMQKCLVRSLDCADSRQMSHNSTCELMKAIPSLFVSELRQFDWRPLFEIGLKLLATPSPSNGECMKFEGNLAQSAWTMLDKFKFFVGDKTFDQYLQRTRDPQLVAWYQGHAATVLQSGTIGGKASNGQMWIAQQCRYGVVPMSVMDAIDCQAESAAAQRARCEALETLKFLMDNASEFDMKKLQPHAFSFFNYLGCLLDDFNIKVIVGALEILLICLKKLSQACEPHLQQIVTINGKQYGNQKNAVRRLNAAIAQVLARACGPTKVVAALCSFLQHRSSRVKEETLNIITLALLTYPAEEFNLGATMHVVAPLGADPKRRVRLAAFECLAVLADRMGNAKIDSIHKCVARVEETRCSTGYCEAVKARLMKQKLPRVRQGDGLLEYSDLNFLNMKMPKNKIGSVDEDQTDADWLWILSAGLGPGSAVFGRSISPIRVKGNTLTSSVDKPITNGEILSENFYSRSTIRKESAQKISVDVDSAERSLILTTSDLSKVDEKPLQASHRVLMSDAKMSFLFTCCGFCTDKSISKVLPIMGETQVVSSDYNSISDITGRNLLSFANHRAPNDRLMFMQNKSKSSDVITVRKNTIDQTQAWDDVPIKANNFNRIHNQEKIAGATNMDASSSNLGEKLKNLMKRSSAESSERSFKTTAPNQESLDEAKISPDFAGLTQKSCENVDHQSTSHKPKIGKSAAKPKAHSEVLIVTDKFKSDSATCIFEMERILAGNPEEALQIALKKLKGDEWRDKMEGLSIVQRLAERKHAVLVQNVHAVILALNNEAKNLRSTVSRQALDCYAHLFGHLKREMDPEVEGVCRVLVVKTGDASNAFIREDALKALECMVDFVSPRKSLFGLAAVGADHKNAIVRSACAQLIRRLVENLGAEVCLSQSKDFVEKMLTTAAKFSSDSQPQPRLHGKATLAILALVGSTFDQVVRKTMSESQLTSVLRAAKSANVSSTVQSASSSLSRHGSVKSSIRSQKFTKISNDDACELSTLAKDLTSSDWEQRSVALEKFRHICTACPDRIGKDVKLLEAYMQRLNDINSKISAQALDLLPFALKSLASHMSDTLRPVANEMLKNLCSQLPSKNEEIRALALNGIESAIKMLDNTALIQNISTLVKTSNIKQKVDLIKFLGDLCNNLYALNKTKSIQMHGIPVVQDLLKICNQDFILKSAIFEYIRQLEKLFGKKTLEEMCIAFPVKEKLILHSYLTEMTDKSFE